MIFSFFTLISRFMGLARDLVITAVMGASSNIAADAYNTALAFPNLFRRIFAEGAFTAAFVPAYSSMLEQEGKDAADRLATNALATLAAMTLVLCIAFQLGMPWIMHVFSAGYVNDPEKFKLTVLLTQITMPYLPAMSIVALLSGVLNAKGRFVVSAVAPTLLNLVMLLIVWPQKTPLDAAYAASWGVVIAGVAQVLLLIWAVKKSGATIGLVWPGLTPQIKNLLILAVPGAMAAAATQINVFVSQWLSSAIDGARSWLTVADRLYQLPLGLIGVAIGVALLPALSRAVGAKDNEGAQKTMDQAVLFSMLLSFPAVAAIIGMPHYLIDGLYGRGQFNPHDVSETSKALLHYGWGVPAFVLSRILNPAFFARKDTFGPMKFALVSVIVNIGLGLTLFPIMGVAGLAIATSSAAWVNVVLMWVVLGMRGTWVISKPALIALLKVLGAGLIAIGLYWLAQSMRGTIELNVQQLIHLKHGLKEITVVGVCFAGLILYIGLLFAFGAIKPSDLRALLRRK
jgi:putative peptidoglycan lipid II flippase